ncbi:hypothetical protein K501DRAFT_335935 [Backusella circina FSU 941]|nr:hypothetical protein K501DRAFT_335935 [Backusella circina FSU 941]
MTISEKNTTYYNEDDDCLVDYDESDCKNHGITVAGISNHFRKYRNNISRRRATFVLEYSKEGLIKCPQEETVSMEMIRSVILVQHCCIKKSDLKWFEDGISWLAQKQHQGSPFERNTVDLQELEDLERSCEAYFDVPLALCENHWAAVYLLKQVKKGLGFHRKLLQPPTKRFSLKSLFQRFFCIPLVTKKKKSRTFHYGVEDCNENHWTL